MFIFVPFSESIYSIKLSVHLVHKRSTYWIHMHILYCCCYFNSFTAYLLYMYIYPLSASMLAIQTQAHKSLALYNFFLRVFARKDAIICCCSFVVLLFSCLFIIHIRTDYTRRDTSTFEILYGFLLLFHFVFLCCFLFFVFRLCFHLFIWFDSTSLHWLFVLLNIEHIFAIVCTSQRANSLKFNLIFVSI